MADPNVELLETGTVPAESVARRLVELDRLMIAPAEVVERGEDDRLWEMVYFLRSGVAF